MADCIGSIFTYNNRIDYQQKHYFSYAELLAN